MINEETNYSERGPDTAAATTGTYQNDDFLYTHIHMYSHFEAMSAVAEEGSSVRWRPCT